MNLSEFPDLRQYRDELAREIQEKRGGGYLAAVSEANAAAQGVYAKAVSEAGGGGKKRGGKAVREAVSRTIRGVARGTVVIPAPGSKPQRGRRDDAMISEVIKAAVDRVVAESLNGRPAPGGALPEAPAAPRRLLREFTDDELFDQVGEVLGAHAAYVASAVREASPANDPESFPSRTPEELRHMSDSDFLDYAGGALAANAPPLRGPSPFMQGLR